MGVEQTIEVPTEAEWKHLGKRLSSRGSQFFPYQKPLPRSPLVMSLDCEQTKTIPEPRPSLFPVHQVCYLAEGDGL